MQVQFKLVANKAIYTLLIIFFYLNTVLLEDVTYESTPDYNMDFKVHLAGYKQDCYYQYFKENSNLHVVLNVVHGRGDMKLDMIHVYDPQENQIFLQENTEFSWYNNDSLKESGDYKVCLTNKKFHDRLVYLNIVSFLTQETLEKTQEANKLNQTHTQLMDSAIKIIENVNTMRRSQILSRVIHGADWYYIETNNEYVMYYSIAQSIVIVLSGIIQTFFIRRLFETPSNSSKTYKPRA